MANKEYRAVSNFFKNTCGLTKGEIHGILKEIMQEMIKDELRRYFQTNEFFTLIGQQLTKHRFGSFEDGIREDITKAVEKVIREKLNEMGLKITFKGMQNN